MKLSGKVAVVTGASMGIGEAIAKRFVAEGAAVALTSRDLARAEAARQRICAAETKPISGPDQKLGDAAERTFALACDVRRRSDLENLLRQTVERFRRVDIWVNNAGHGLLDSVAKMSMAECRAMFDTNLFGAVEAMQIVIPQMQHQGGGTIANISSVAGHIAVPGMAAYCATKAALNTIGKAARVELQKTGVHVMTVCPGYIQTDFALNAVKGADRQRISAAARGISPDRVAAAVLNGYLRNKREVVVPAQDRLLIKLYQACPQLMEWSMARMLRPADQVIAEQQARKLGH
jgi:short-subunit dehydrogenase